MSNNEARRITINKQIAILITVAIAAAVAFGVVFFKSAEFFVVRYLDTSEYVQHEDEKNVKGLQKFIDENEITKDNILEIEKWKNKAPDFYFEIFDDYEFVYSSVYGTEAGGITIDDTTYEKEYTINIDGRDMYLFSYSAYTGRIYLLILMADVLCSFALFLIIILSRIRKKTKYIKQIRDDVEYMEGGNLEKPVEMQGNDELSDLAGSLDDMRNSFIYQLEKERTLEEANKTLITELSHDIRTPLATMKVYTEAVKYGKYKDGEELEKYLNRIDEKADQINELADGILKYSKKNIHEKEEGAKANVIADANRQISIEEFIVLINEKIAEYLEMRGFTTVVHNNCDNGEIGISEALIQRLMDNVVSNIEKYADEAENIIISLDRETNDKAGAVVLSIDNGIRKADEDTEDNGRKGIGIMTIARLMEDMNGSYEYEEKDNHFMQKMIWVE